MIFILLVTDYLFVFDTFTAINPNFDLITYNILIKHT